MHPRELREKEGKKCHTLMQTDKLKGRVKKIVRCGGGLSASKIKALYRFALRGPLERCLSGNSFCQAHAGIPVSPVLPTLP